MDWIKKRGFERLLEGVSSIVQLLAYTILPKLNLNEWNPKQTIL